MERRDRGRERFLRALQLSGALRLARARKNRARPGVRAGVPSAIAECDSLITSNRSYMSCSNAAAPGLGFRCERSERILGEKRPRPLLFCRMTEVQFLVAGSKA